MKGPVMMRLPGNRLHFNHGPIDLIIKADGKDELVEAVYAAGWRRFDTILEELTAELPLLRRPLGVEPPWLRSPTALRMLSACWPHRENFITPMAAVAGAVAEEILASMVAAERVDRIMINNGGDIAIHLDEGEKVTLGIAGDLDVPEIEGRFTLHSYDPSRGVATSGWRGRSQSLGIADAVTVLARTASYADASATMIANAVDIDHPAISRLPAVEVKDDSDLGDLLVTVDVGDLPREAVGAALSAGEERAQELLDAGLIHGAALLLQGQTRFVEHRTRRLFLEDQLCL